MTRTIRTLLTLILLMAGYAGYGRLFAMVAGRVPTPEPLAEYRNFGYKPSETEGAKQAAALIERAFGEHHWTSGRVSNVNSYYNTKRGHWMFFSRYSFPEKYNQTRVELTPFALIAGSEKDGSLKVMTGDRAIVDFDAPFELLGAGPKPNVIHARIEGIDEQVLILDDKGTETPTDDLVISMPYAEYFEKQMQIRCDEAVRMVDEDVQIDGTGLVISLRAPEVGGGFPGAEVITLNRDVVITSEDVGRTGIMPGSALPEQQAAGASAEGQAPESAKTPVLLSCSGSMRIQFPKPRLPARVGPPAPPRPTIAEFARNVLIERGLEAPDRITGDQLQAVLIPRERRAPPDSEGVEGASKPPPGPGGLRLLEARVSGHAVWLESKSERVRVRGNELIYRKPDQDGTDISYFRADEGQQVEFERVELDEAGEVKSLVTIWSADATLHGDPGHQGRTTVIARGPGRQEMRSGREMPVERWATWQDEMIVETSLKSSDEPTGPDDDGTRTFITLVGWPVLNDPKQVTLAARDEVVVSLKPQAEEDPSATASDADADADDPGSGRGKGRSYRVEWLSARGDVHMITPEGVERSPAAAGIRTAESSPSRELRAREKLDVVFSYLDPIIERADADPSAPVTAAPPEPSAAPEPDLVDTEAAAVEPDQPDPPFMAEADTVWARVVVDGNAAPIDLAGQSSGGRRDVREARLRGDAMVHQDPAPGRQSGLHADADYGIDLENPGPGALRIHAHGVNRPVTLAAEEFYLQGFPGGPSGAVVLGLDQRTDHAFVRGPGRIWNLPDREAMGRLDRASQKDDEAPGGDKEPMIITWIEQMDFYGQFADPEGAPGPARALFLGDVKSRHGDAGASCQELEAIFDRPVSFDRLLPGGDDAPADADLAEGEDSGRLEVDSVICINNVDLWSILRDDTDPETPVEQRKVVEFREAFGNSVTFDRASDTFWIDGEGSVSVATLDDGRADSPRPRIIPAADRDGARAPAAPKIDKLRVEFNDGLQGQLGTAGGGERLAVFEGDARALRAPVPSFRTVLDFDRPPSGFVRLDSETITVESTPAIKGVPERNFLKAFGDARARSDNKTLLGDTITYDSITQLFYVRGRPGAPATIVNQESFGQSTSRGPADAFWYNVKTGEGEGIGTQSLIFFRPDTGGPAGLAEPPKPKEKKPRKRLEPRLPANNDMERKGFTGQ